MLCRAKINLTLHVGAPLPSGRWQGYHPVESLVVFADIGDHIAFGPSADDRHSLALNGPFAGKLQAGPDNLVVQALEACDALPTHAVLTKSLPVSAGLGGGSANAAAVLRAFDPQGEADAAALGADVPVCRLSRTAMMEGIGERITAMPALGRIPAVLVNPGVAVPTGEVFALYDAGTVPSVPGTTVRSGTLLDRAVSGRNDLEETAIAIQPVIAELLARLGAQEGCALARMSGSGATCFGLFDTMEAAQRAARDLERDGWWVAPVWLGDDD
ncbi:MAG: 4-(cytidine 5'-diphospho)-2-C-methyl-D-erythritol kinase [Pseudomonadota bacterium]